MPKSFKEVKDIRKALPKNFSKESEEGERPINTLPDYEIRTMRDDLAELGLKKLEIEAKGLTMPEEIATVPEAGPPVSKRGIAPPQELPVAPKRTTLPGTEELIAKKEELPLPPKPEAEPAPEEEPTPPKIEELKIPKPSYVPPSYAPSLVAKRKTKTLVLITLIAIVVLIGAGAIFYWLGKKEPTPPSPPTPPVITPQPSSPLISVNQIKTISLIPEKSLFELLKEEAKLDQPIGTFKRIAVLKNEKEFFSLVELLQNLEISIPPYAMSDFGGNYNLVLYNQATGKRLGLIAEVANPENLKEQLKNWEPDMLDDFKNFYPVQVPGPRASQNFLDDIHQGVKIRYVNLPKPDLTLNYTIINNLLIIGTSKELMYTVIDKILGLQ